MEQVEQVEQARGYNLAALSRDWYTGNWVVRRVYRQRRRLESDEAGEAGIVLYMM